MKRSQLHKPDGAQIDHLAPHAMIDQVPDDLGSAVRRDELELGVRRKPYGSVVQHIEDRVLLQAGSHETAHSQDEPLAGAAPHQLFRQQLVLSITRYMSGIDRLALPRQLRTGLVRIDIAAGQENVSAAGTSFERLRDAAHRLLEIKQRLLVGEKFPGVAVGIDQDVAMGTR